ncbi:MAG: pantetheine-phosphate adenylyltransferase [Pyramidobacter sp.]|nr:pantetheine-phosphate adenylyltransferase [Pyramidobacter sp.]
MYRHKALYPGSFDPITNGHVFIAERAAALFDELEVSILINSGKTAAFTLEERVEMAREALKHLPNVTVNSFEGLLVDFLRQRKSSIVIRGLRALSDFEYEFQMALMNRKLAPEMETLFIVTDARFSYLSSHTLKDVFRLGGDVRDLVPACVYQRLVKKYRPDAHEE